MAYEALSGRVPEEAPARMEDDTLRPMTEVSAHGVSPGFADAIGAALALRGPDRPQSVGEWRKLLGLPAAGGMAGTTEGRDGAWAGGVAPAHARESVIPYAEPGDDVERHGDKRYVLNRPAATPGKSREACLKAMSETPLRMTLSWEELRRITREP